MEVIYITERSVSSYKEQDSVEKYNNKTILKCLYYCHAVNLSDSPRKIVFVPFLTIFIRSILVLDLEGLLSYSFICFKISQLRDLQRNLKIISFISFFLRKNFKKKQVSKRYTTK